MAEIVTMAQEELRERGAADAAALAAKAVSGDADGTALIAGENQIPTWRQRDYSSVPVGTPYKCRGRSTSCGSSMTPPSNRTGARTKQ